MTRTYHGMFDEALARDATRAAGSHNEVDGNAEALKQMIALASGADAPLTAQQREELDRQLREMEALSSVDTRVLTTPLKQPNDGVRERVRERGDETDYDCDRPHGTPRPARYQGNER